MKAYDDMDYAQIECPECAKQITVESSAAVENIACPYCKFTVVIPPSLQEPMLSITNAITNVYNQCSITNVYNQCSITNAP